MRILILGGGWFLGRTLAADALAKGWDVTAFTRGRSGRPPAGVRHVLGDRTDEADLQRLATEGTWDAVIDTSAYEPIDVARTTKWLGSKDERRKAGGGSCPHHPSNRSNRSTSATSQRTSPGIFGR
jgi:NAD(P)-dependent dehydrogenase (short-subunit alcohol dehydrogenase family)